MERAIEIHFSQKTDQTPKVVARASTIGKSSSSRRDNNDDESKARSSFVSMKHAASMKPMAKMKERSVVKGGRDSKAISSFFAPRKQPSSSSLSQDFPRKTGPQSKRESNPLSLTLSIQSSPPTKRLKPNSTEGQPTVKSAYPLSQTKRPPNPTDDRLQYQALAEAFESMASTTKRLAKLDSLERVLTGIIEAVGGIGGIPPVGQSPTESSSSLPSASSSSSSTSLELDDSRRKDATVLTSALELILGSTRYPLQVSGSSVSKAVQTVTGCTAAQLRVAYRKMGDLGDAADSFVANQKLLFEPKPLSIVVVHETLEKIAKQQGKGSQQQRHQLMTKLMRSCRGKELRFLIRILLGNMRLGANQRTILAALAMALHSLSNDNTKNNNNKNVKNAKPEEKAATVKAVLDVFDFCPRLDKLSWALLSGGLSCIQRHCIIEVGTPIQPMLAGPAHSMEEVAKMMADDGGEAIAEWKYDGVRCQAHYHESNSTDRNSKGADPMVTLYSRHLLDSTAQYPDAVRYFLQAKKPSVTSFIVDSEIVGVHRDESTGKIRMLPFQELSTRRGLTDLNIDDQKGKSTVTVRVFAFDLMYLNGRSLVDKPLHERKEALFANFTPTKDFAFAQQINLQTFDESTLNNFLGESVEGGAEGLMVKLTGKKVGDDNLGRLNGNKEIDNQVDPDGKAHVKEKDLLPSNNRVQELKDKPLSQPQQHEPCPHRYESGARSPTWLKVKRDYVSGFADTIDVVPIGAWYGNGRKAQKGFLSPVLLAIYDPEEDVYRSISRCMSFTDAMYDAMREFYFHGTPYPPGVGLDDKDDEREGQESTTEPKSIEHDGNDSDHENGNDADEDKESNPTDADRVNCYPSKPSALVVTNETPTIWFKPSEVFEVSFADLSLSKQHTAAAGLVDSDGRGVAMRFPRFKRRRPDKGIGQATTSAEVANLFFKQAKQA